MRGSSHLAAVFLALLFLFASAKCSIACAVAPCESTSFSNLPPCHRHHHAPADQSPLACAHPMAVALAAPSVVHLTPPQPVATLVSTSAFMRPLPAAQAKVSQGSASPPGFLDLSSVVLRV